MKNKLMVLVGLIMTMTSAQADIWLDGQLTDAELFDYNLEVSLGYDMNGLYEFGGNYFETLVDTTVNMNHQVLFEDGVDRTYYTDTGAETIYQANAGSTIADVIQYYTANTTNKDFGFKAEILRGTDRQGDRFEYVELANGMFQNTAHKGIVISKRQVRSSLEKFGEFDTVYVESRFSSQSGERIPTKWVGITEASIYELNKDKFELTVKRGMNKGQVAAAMGITMKELYAANPGLQGRFMTIGESLKNGKTSFEQGDHIVVRGWDKAEISGKSFVKDRNTFGKEIFANAPTNDSAIIVGYVVQSDNNKGTVMRALGVSKATLNSSNEGFASNFLRKDQLVVSGGVYFTDGIVPVLQALGNQNVEVAADTQQYVFDVINTSILSDMEVNAWKNDLIKNAIHNK